MKNIRNRFERFCLRNRDKGIPNLMLYIVLGNAVVTLLGLFNSGSALYSLLCFDKASILNGQVWRLFTYVFTQSSDGIFGLIFLYFFYMLGRHVELSMGTFRFNLYYLSGVILMDIFAMIFCPVIPMPPQTQEQYMLLPVLYTYQSMAYYLHLSLLLTFATTNPDSQFMIFFVIPIKAWVIAIIYLVLVAADVFNLSFPVLYLPHNLFPLVALGNYLLFVGKDIANLLPLHMRPRRNPKPRASAGGPIPFRKETPAAKPNYNHRCTVCGRTDVSNPELEFRYCSRCKGYHCYCEDHINNHEHIQ